jgi:hypothetical protein
MSEEEGSGASPRDGEEAARRPLCGGWRRCRGRSSWGSRPTARPRLIGDGVGSAQEAFVCPDEDGQFRFDFWGERERSGLPVDLEGAADVVCVLAVVVAVPEPVEDLDFVAFTHGDGIVQGLEVRFVETKGGFDAGVVGSNKTGGGPRGYSGGDSATISDAGRGRRRRGFRR